jgi:hypothetical protein
VGLFIEESIINSVKTLLAGRVNELLGEMECTIPPIEFGQSGYTGLSGEFRQGRNSTAFYGGGSTVVPVIALSACERSEKERIIWLDAYTLTVSFTVPEHPEGERNCYAYAAAVDKALREDPVLGGGKPGGGNGKEVCAAKNAALRGGLDGNSNPESNSRRNK